MSETNTLPEQVFSESDSDWNVLRVALEKALVQAAVGLMAHTGASNLKMDNNGVSLEVRCYETH